MSLTCAENMESSHRDYCRQGPVQSHGVDCSLIGDLLIAG